MEKHGTKEMLADLHHHINNALQPVVDEGYNLPVNDSLRDYIEGARVRIKWALRQADVLLRESLAEEAKAEREGEQNGLSQLQHGAGGDTPQDALHRQPDRS